MSADKEIKIWGVVKDGMQHSMPYVSVKLLKKIQHNKRSYYEEIDRGWTDEAGYYTFFVQAAYYEVYKVVVLVCEES